MKLFSIWQVMIDYVAFDCERMSQVVYMTRNGFTKPLYVIFRGTSTAAANWTTNNYDLSIVWRPWLISRYDWGTWASANNNKHIISC